MKRKFLPKKETGLLKKITFWTITTGIFLFFLSIISLAAIFIYFSIGLPSIDELGEFAAQSTEIYDREGNLLYTIHGEENREIVTLENISPYLIESTVALEDADFWTHPGIDVLALGKVFLHEIFGIGVARGGSTITQQYVKNTYLSSEHSYSRKVKEIILSRRIEKAKTKEQILELYLNKIPYGNNAYGIQKASEIYFAKDAKDLSIAESAILAALPQAPSYYNPFGNNRYSHLNKEFTVEELEKRPIKSQSDLKDDEYIFGLIGSTISLADGTEIYIAGRTDIALNSMVNNKVITEQEKTEAKEILKTIEFNNYTESIKHPHFVLYIKEQLEAQYGKEKVEQGGLKVYTTLDPNIQKRAEEIATEKSEINETKYGANNIAILTINAKTGDILAMLGSKDYWNEEIHGNVNVVMRPRQPGSAFKPFVYAQAFYNGYAPGNVIYDVPMRLGSARPQNYEGGYKGQMTIRKALGLSRNIPAIKAYFLAGEQEEIIRLVEKMGITTLDNNFDYGWPLALGSGEVPLYEMVNAYAVFATNGKKPEISGILKIENGNGDVIFEREKKEFEEVIDPEIAFLINSILSDKENSVGPNLFISGKINATKTGTSTKENKKEAGGALVRPSNAWTIGYTPSIVTGVWVGNTNGEGLNFNANGYDAASPIFNAVMTEALKNEGTEPFPEPEGIQHVKISKASGKLPGENTPASYIISDVFPSMSIPTEKEQIFFTVKIDKISKKLATEFTPEEAIEEVVYQNYEPIKDLFNWKEEIISYYKSKEGGVENGIKIGLPPSEYDDVHTAITQNSKPRIEITSPTTNSRLVYGAFQIDVDINAPNHVEKVEYYINDDLQYFTTTAPYTGHLNISKFIQPGTNQLIVAKVIDSLGYSSQYAIEVKVSKDLDTTDINTDTTTTTTTTETPTTPEIIIETPTTPEVIVEPPVTTETTATI